MQAQRTWVTNQKGGLADSPDRFSSEKTIGASKVIRPNKAAHCPLTDPGLCSEAGESAIINPAIISTSSMLMAWLGRSGRV